MVALSLSYLLTAISNTVLSLSYSLPIIEYPAIRHNTSLTALFTLSQYLIIVLCFVILTISNNLK